MEDGGHLPLSRQLSPHGFVQALRSYAFAPRDANVDQRSSDSGARDPLDFGDVTGDQISRTVDDVLARWTPEFRGRDFDDFWAFQEIPQMSGSGVAGYGSLP